eukprot:TRINITY_DN1707_c0_g3_i1.p1 TRINITY_DN1707_c0_g3~~TRINITY_DN1707_c0_g3_i1.p1  ORF type:complete len:117 (+),score=13.14 TRINITY_DN1707_c0_g3_i1:386-736(+)
MVGPITLANNERQWFFIVQDYFSKEVMLRKLCNCTAKEWNKVFEQEVLWTKDNSEHVISDGDTNIVGTEFCKLCQKMGINHNYNTKYHQQGNGQVESAVKTVKPILLAKLFKDKMP